jgi:hypothetical protein
LASQKSEHDLILHELLLAGTSGNHHHIQLRTVRVGHRRHDHQAAVSLHWIETLRHEMNRGVGQARQDLIGAGQIQLGQPGEKQHPDLALRGHV